jgi:hypothetical protein
MMELPKCQDLNAGTLNGTRPPFTGSQFARFAQSTLPPTNLESTATATATAAAAAGPRPHAIMMIIAVCTAARQGPAPDTSTNHAAAAAT